MIPPKSKNNSNKKMNNNSREKEEMKQFKRMLVECQLTILQDANGLCKTIS